MQPPAQLQSRQQGRHPPPPALEQQQLPPAAPTMAFYDDDAPPPLDDFDDDAMPPLDEAEEAPAPAPAAATPAAAKKSGATTNSSLLGLESKLKDEPFFMQTKNKQEPERSAAHEALIAQLAPKKGKQAEAAKAAEEVEYKAKAKPQKPIAKGFFDRPAKKSTGGKKKKKKKPAAEAEEDIEIVTPGAWPLPSPPIACGGWPQTAQQGAAAAE